jgi:hypothetical protein
MSFGCNVGTVAGHDGDDNAIEIPHVSGPSKETIAALDLLESPLFSWCLFKYQSGSF